MRMGDLLILGAYWFTHVNKTVGIVCCENTLTKERKVYIGVGRGENEEADIKLIVEWGAVFPVGVANFIKKLYELEDTK